MALSVDEHQRKQGAAVSADSLTTYVLDLASGEHRQLGNGVHTFVASPQGHTFLYYDEFGISSEAPALIEGLNFVRNFDLGDHARGWWNPRTGDAFFESSWPGDREGFSGLAIVQPREGAVARVALREVTELLAFCGTTGHFFTEHWFEGGGVAGVDEYDAKGKFLRSTKLDRAVFSAKCGYVLPFSAVSPHGPSDWAVYNAATGTELRQFVWNEDGKHDLHLFMAWNPVYDHLLLMHSRNAGTDKSTVDVLDVRTGRIVSTWPEPDNAAPMIWSGDGRRIVTVRDHHIVFERLTPEAAFAQ